MTNDLDFSFDSDFDDEELNVPLPSERKNQSDINNNNEEKKRPPKNKQSTKTIIDLLDSNIKTEISSDKLSHDNIEYSKNNTRETQKNGKIVNNTIKNMSQLEDYLINYINTTIDTIRTQFVEELKYQLSKTSEIDSKISTFILGLPKEVDEIIEQEVKMYYYFQKPEIAVISNTMDSQLNLIRKIIKVSEGPKTLCSFLPEKIENLEIKTDETKNDLEAKINELLDLFKFEKNELLSLQKSQCDHLNSHIKHEKSLEIIEYESTNKQLELEENFIKQRCERLSSQQNNWKEMTSYAETQNEYDELKDLRDIIQNISIKSPQSKLSKAFTSLESLSSTFQSGISEIQNLRNQMEFEYTKLLALRNSKLKRIEHIQQVLHLPEKFIEDNNILTNVKKRLKRMRQKQQKTVF